MQYLGDKKVQSILDMFNYQKTLRSKSDKLRWEAYSLLEHRTKDLSGCADSPVEDIRLYTSEGKKAVDTLVAGFMSALMPRNSKWFAVSIVPRLYEIGQDPVEDLVYASYVEKSMQSELDHTNIYSEAKLGSFDSVIGGYSCMMMQEDEYEHRTNFNTLVPWRCWFDCDRFGNWNTFFYQYTLNGYEMLDRFPDMPEELKDQCKREREHGVYRMLFAIFDRTKMLDYNGEEISLVIGKNMKFGAVHICLDTNQILDESGYRDFPVIIHLWEKVSDSHYGIGLVMKYIHEFRKLNKLAYEFGLSVESINHPARYVPESMRDSFSDDPRARNYFTGSELGARVDNPQDIKQMEEALSIEVDAIRRICYNDYMNFLTTHEQVYTATQVNQLKSESLSQIAPLSDNVTGQKILPILKLTFVNMYNNGRIMLPENGVMSEVDEKGDRRNLLNFTIVSAMSEQLNMYTKFNAVQSIQELGLGFVNMTQDPTVISDNFKVGNMLKVAARAVGADADFIMTSEETKQIQMQREQQQAQAQQMAMAEQQSVINRNNAGAANLNNIAGMNGGAE